MQKFPKPDYGKEYYEGKSGLTARLFQPIASLFYSIRSAYPEKTNIELWIDIGAGEGGYLKTVTAKRKIGVEVSSAGRKLMKQTGLETMTEKEFLQSKGLHADVISFWHVLEHVENPWDYLAAARKNLNKSGKIVIGVPNVDSFEFKLFKKYWFHLVPRHHLWHYSPKSMRMLLKKNNFSLEKTDYWSLEHHLTGILQSFINKSSGSDSVLHRLVKRKENLVKISVKDALWSAFWMTFGMPFVFGFLIVGALLHKSGTMVIVATKS